VDGSYSGSVTTVNANGMAAGAVHIDARHSAVVIWQADGQTTVLPYVADENSTVRYSVKGINASGS
jgi:hypothetical protein